MGQKPGSRLTDIGLSLQLVLQGLVPLPQLVLQHTLHLLNHLEGRAQRLGWPRGSTPARVWLGLGSLALRAPAFSWCLTVSSSAFICCILFWYRLSSAACGC